MGWIVKPLLQNFGHRSWPSFKTFAHVIKTGADICPYHESKETKSIFLICELNYFSHLSSSVLGPSSTILLSFDFLSYQNFTQSTPLDSR